MPLTPESPTQISPEEHEPLRLSLDTKREELIRSAQYGYGVDEAHLIAIFGEDDVRAYLSNPHNLVTLGGNDAA